MASRRPAAGRGAARRVAATTTFQLQLRIELRGIKPVVWRRVLVPENITLAKLHVILQWVMGWTDSHLHEYAIAQQRYGLLDDEGLDEEPIIDERRVRLKSLVETGLRRFIYLYDFGDHWEHIVKVEDIVPPEVGAQRVLCTAGENACPPEDVGGLPGYAEFLAILNNPHHEEYRATLKWAGGPFDPTAFDIAEINQRLATIKA